MMMDMQNTDTHHRLQYDLMIKMFDRWQEENEAEDDHNNDEFNN
jgi:hypothetical protein